MPAEIINNVTSIKYEDDLAVIKLLLTDSDGTAYPLVGKTIVARFRNDKTFLMQKDVTEIEDGYVILRITKEDSRNLYVGAVYIEIAVYDAAGSTRIFPEKGFIEINIDANASVIVNNEVSVISLDYFQDRFNAKEKELDTKFTEQANEVREIAVSAVIPDEGVTNQKLANESVTIDKASGSLGFNQYPFHPRALISSDLKAANQLRTAIKNVTLLNADLTKKYAITDFKRNSSGTWRLDVHQVTDNSLVTLVARFNSTTYAEPSGITQINLSEQNASGISGIVVIDWTQIDIGNYALSEVNNVYALRGLDVTTYTHNLDKSITGEMLDDFLSNYSYPFKERSKLGSTKVLGLQVRKAFKDVQLFGVDFSKEYAIVDVKKNNASRWRIDLWEVNGSTLIKQVALFHVENYVPKNNVESITLNPVSNSVITAKVIIDWSQLNNAFNSSSTVYAAERNLSVLTYNDKLADEEFFATSLPPKMYLVPNKEISIYYDAVTLVENIENYTFVSSGGGENQLERVVFDYDRSLYDNNYLKDFTTTLKIYKGSNLKSTETVDFKVVDPDAGEGKEITSIIIGDSTTDQNFAVRELLNNFSDDVMKLKLIGTRGTAPAFHEGYSGWSAIDFLTKASFNNRDNAFYNPETGMFDFTYYMNQQGYTNSGLKNAVINLGINDSHTNTDYNVVMEHFQTMIDSIKAYDPNIIIGVCVTIPNAKLRPGIYPIKKEQILMAKKIIETFRDRESEGIHLVPINANLDTVRGFKYEEVPASSRSTEIVKRNPDGLHPNSYTGYPQIADSLFAYLKYIEGLS